MGHQLDAVVLDLYSRELVLGDDSRFLREASISFGQPTVGQMADSDLPVLAQRRPDLGRLRLTAVTLPFDLEEPPDGCRYTETTVQMTFDSPDVRSLKLSRLAPAGIDDDSDLDTRGVGRPQLTWKLTARSAHAGLRPTGRQVVAVLESPAASEWLTGTLDASIRFTRRMLGVATRSSAEPRYPLRFALNVVDGTFTAAPDEEPAPGR